MFVLFGIFLIERLLLCLYIWYLFDGFFIVVFLGLGFWVDGLKLNLLGSILLFFIWRIFFLFLVNFLVLFVVNFVFLFNYLFVFVS